MANLIRRKLTSVALAAITIAAAGGLIVMSSQPALALCKYGGPNCVTGHVGEPIVKDEKVKIPESDWRDPDCKHYGNCATNRGISGQNLGNSVKPMTNRAQRR
jgi:hypothetical protein